MLFLHGGERTGSGIMALVGTGLAWNMLVISVWALLESLGCSKARWCAACAVHVVACPLSCLLSPDDADANLSRRYRWLTSVLTDPTTIFE